MNATHIHLLITHLPIFGSILGAIVLAYALNRRNDDTKMASYFLFVLSAIGGVIAYLTGEPAEEKVEHLQGVTHDAIHEHEDAALFALISFIILGLISLVGMYIIRKKTALSRKMAIVILILSLFSFSVVLRTGWLGGQIRHTEMNDKSIEHEEHENSEPDND
jgi:uncharacterized membrane protein